MKPYLPASIVKRTKQPYLAPDSKSFFNGRSEDSYVEELLSEDCIRRYGYFRPDAVRLLASKCRNGKVTGFKDNMALVGILSTQLLHRQFVEDFRAEEPEIHVTTRNS
jgi:asparagine synthase (glutamine-hydrolysing)